MSLSNRLQYRSLSTLCIATQKTAGPSRVFRTRSVITVDASVSVNVPLNAVLQSVHVYGISMYVVSAPSNWSQEGGAGGSPLLCERVPLYPYDVLGTSMIFWVPRCA